MSRLRRPFDKSSAKDVMKKFSDLAYSLSHLDIFQDAVHILYGREFTVTPDLSKRMQFGCQICNREMNSENAMAEHFRSGAHQKNLDKKSRDTGEGNYSVRASHYANDSIQFKLLNSHQPPVGLQMIEEYINRRGNTYYKCILCGAHGKMDTMYHHVIGKKHTEKYIKSGCVLDNSIVTSNEREEIKQKLVKLEGVNVDAIKTIRGNEFYPYKWEREGFATKVYNVKIKKERRSPSQSPSPGPSWSRGQSRRRSRSRSPYRRHSRSPSRKWSRSPSRRWSRSPSRKWSRSPSSRRSRSPHSRKSYSTNSKKKRFSERGSSSEDGSLGHSPRRRRAFSPKIKIKKEKISPIRVKREKMSPPRVPTPPRIHSPPRAFSVARDVGNLAAYRNKSPPPLVKVKTEPVTPMVHKESEDHQLSIPMPIHPSTIKKEKKDAFVQTKVDLEDMMMHLNSLVAKHNRGELLLKSSQDVKGAIFLMESLANTLRELTVTVIEDGTYKSRQMKESLVYQKQKREKIIGYITKWYKPTWEQDLSKQK